MAGNRRCDHGGVPGAEDARSILSLGMSPSPAKSLGGGRPVGGPLGAAAEEAIGRRFALARPSEGGGDALGSRGAVGLGRGIGLIFGAALNPGGTTAAGAFASTRCTSFMPHGARTSGCVELRPMTIPMDGGPGTDEAAEGAEIYTPDQYGSVSQLGGVGGGSFPRTASAADL